MTTRRPLATAREVSEFLSVPETTLRQWRYHRIGPRYSKLGQLVRYTWDDVEAWLEANHKATA